MFVLMDSEQKKLQEINNALDILYGENSVDTTTYMFTPCGIGVICEVKIKLRNGHEIIKDITSIEEW